MQTFESRHEAQTKADSHAAMHPALRFVVRAVGWRKFAIACCRPSAVYIDGLAFVEWVS